MSKVTFQCSELWPTGYLYGRKRRLFAFTVFHTYINPRQIVDLKVKGKTIRLLEENIGEYLYDLGVKSTFLIS